MKKMGKKKKNNLMKIIMMAKEEILKDWTLDKK